MDYITNVLPLSRHNSAHASWYDGMMVMGDRLRGHVDEFG